MALAIMTDSNSDFPYDKLEQYDLEMLYMPYFIDGKQYIHDMGKGTRSQEFFDAMRAGRDLKTSMLNPLQYIDYFEPILRRGDDILFICMSHSLSSTFDNAHVARNEMLEKYPRRRIEIIDSRSMSIGMTQTTEAALDMRAQGRTIDEIRDYLEECVIPQQHIIVTVDNLAYLKKSGRLTGAAAFFGTMLDIKPVIFIDYEGRLIAQEKVKGRRQSMKLMVKRMQENIREPEGQVLRIAQADCPEDAEKLREMCLEAMPMLGGVEISYLGPVIAVHVGPGTLGLMWRGKNRNPQAQSVAL